ncbi:MAG: hypothetical protein H7257_14530 [Taibaiella sp.]|nr:hypothetical protein [Taibaiella sp.]
MKNTVLLCMIALSLITGSCVKNINPPLSFLVDTVANVYVNQNDSLILPLEVRFLAGSYDEKVTLTISGLPPHVRLAQDTITGAPTFTANFKFYADSVAPLGNFPVTLISYSATTGYKYYTFNLGVVRYDCGHFVQGNYTGTNTCTLTNYTYAVTATSSGDTGVNIVNLGGYGSNTNAFMRLDCNTDSVYVDQQNIGNGVTMRAEGSFTANRITIRYIALNTPAGYNDTCVAVLNR